MHRGHHAGLDPDPLVQHFGQRREAVGGAGGVRDDRVGRLQGAVIHAINHGRVHIGLARRGDDDLFGAGGEVGPGLRLAGKQARGLMHDIHRQLRPGQPGRVAFGQDPDAVAVDDQMLALDADLARKAAMGRVIAGQMRVRAGVAQVIDRHDPELIRAPRFIQRAQDIAPYAAIAVDAYFNCHVFVLHLEGETLIKSELPRIRYKADCRPAVMLVQAGM